MLRPLLHFSILGAACFALAQAWPGDDPRPIATAPGDTIVITQATIDRHTDEWITRYGSPPTSVERQAMIDAAINDEILYREAVRLRMHLVDPVVRRRLTQNMRFLTSTEGDPDPDDGVLLQRALDLGMLSSDLVVKRRLVQQMQSVFEATNGEPSLEEGRAYVKRHPERFSTSPRFALSYRFEKAEAREADSLGRASGPRETGGTDPVEQSEVPLQSGIFSTRQVSQTFGPAGATRITSLAPGEWTGPLARSGGLYRVRLDRAIPAEPIAFDHVRERALHELSSERGAQALERALESLRKHYQVRIAGGDAHLASAS